MDRIIKVFRFLFSKNQGASTTDVIDAQYDDCCIDLTTVDPEIWPSDAMPWERDEMGGF